MAPIPGCRTDMNITLLTDSINSWFIPFGERLNREMSNLGHVVKYVHKKQDIERGDVCFLLSCSRIIEESYLSLNKNNIVVHASDLPSGKGFAPLQWQILEGKNEIVLTLFEVVKEVDAGPFYFKDKLEFDGTELYDELRCKLGKKIIEMCLRFIKERDTLKPVEQVGPESFFHRRGRKDDELDVYKTIAEQFNHLRIADNDKYPLYFKYLGQTYLIKIYRDDSNA